MKLKLADYEINPFLESKICNLAKLLLEILKIAKFRFERKNQLGLQFSNVAKFFKFQF